MSTNSLKDILTSLGFKDAQSYFSTAFSRNNGLLTPAEQLEISKAVIAIPGLGGVGGAHLITLTRLGFCNFHIADFDTFEPENINRQYGARVEAFGHSKLDQMTKEALSINPYLDIKAFPEGISDSNIEDFLQNVSVVVDSLDFFKFDVRRMLFKTARSMEIPVITAGPVGFSSSMLVFSGSGGMGFDQYFNINDNMSTSEKISWFVVGLSPNLSFTRYMQKIELERAKGPSLASACQLCAGVAATEVIRLVLKRPGVKYVPHYLRFDPYLKQLTRGYLLWGNKNPIQKIKQMFALKEFQAKDNFARSWLGEAPTPNSSEPLPEESLAYIMRAGSLAPSGDNKQPWKFTHGKDQIDLHIERDVCKSFFNVKQIASLIACGAVLENMTIAGKACQLDSSPSYFPNSENSNLLATVKFSKDESLVEPLADYIPLRHTNRKMYKKAELFKSTIDELRGSIEGFDGVELDFVSAKKDLKTLRNLCAMADRVRAEHKPLHLDFHSMLRYSDAEAREKLDGFYLKNLEVGIPGELFLRLTRSWAIQDLLNSIGFSRVTGAIASQGLLNCTGVGLITVPGMTEKDFVIGGQAFQRVWLTLTKLGLSLQPFAALPMFWLRWVLEGEEAFETDHRDLLRKVWPEYLKLFPEQDLEQRGSVMLFRFGQASPIKYRTYRKLPD